MTASRPAGGLPANPALLRLTYIAAQHPGEPEEFDDVLEWWHVTVGVDHDEERECADGCTAACERLIKQDMPVGRLRLCRLREETCEDWWNAADAESGDLEAIVSTVWDVRTDGYSTAFEDAVPEPYGDLLILHRVFLEQPWRGFGLGPVFAAEAIRLLSRGCCAAATYPGPTELPQTGRALTATARRHATVKIARLWQSIGFRVFAGGVMLLDLSQQAPADKLRSGRARLHDLIESHQQAATTAPDGQLQPAAAGIDAGEAGSEAEER